MATANAACSMRQSWVEYILLAYRDWDNSFNILLVSGCDLAVPDQAACSLRSPLRASLGFGCLVMGGALKAIRVVEV